MTETKPLSAEELENLIEIINNEPDIDDKHHFLVKATYQTFLATITERDRRIEELEQEIGIRSEILDCTRKELLVRKEKIEQLQSQLAAAVDALLYLRDDALVDAGRGMYEWCGVDADPANFIDESISDLTQAAEAHDERIREEGRQEERAKYEWQPIETAPKDGTPILAYNETGVMYTVWYEGGMWCFSSTKTIGRLGFNPTRWMPLPEAPQKAGV